MSDAAAKLAQTRLAIIAQLQGRERRHQHRGAERYEDPHQDAQDEEETERPRARRGRGAGRRSPAGWLHHAQHAARNWWRHHPASMGLELVTPALSSYAARKPVQYLAIAAALGAVFMVVRPWRLISVTGLIVAIVKSSQLSSVVMSAMSGADFGKEDEEPPV